MKVITNDKYEGGGEKARSSAGGQQTFLNSFEIKCDHSDALLQHEHRVFHPTEVFDEGRCLTGGRGFQMRNMINADALALRSRKKL